MIIFLITGLVNVTQGSPVKNPWLKKRKEKKRQPSGVSTPNIVSTRYHVQQVLEGHTAPSLHLQSNPVFRLSHPDINQSLDSYNEIGL